MEAGLYPDLEYSFTHALTHEVAYGGLLQERRRELHARIVDAIESLHRDRLGEEIERLAQCVRATADELCWSGKYVPVGLVEFDTSDIAMPVRKHIRRHSERVG